MIAFDDSALRAYLRGDLSAAEMDRIEAAMADDPALIDRLERLADSAEDEGDASVRDAFAPVEGLAMPERLTAALATSVADNKVVDFAAAAAARRLPRWSWPQMGAMAASLAVGLFAGQAFLGGQAGGGGGDAIVLASADGARLAPAVGAFLDQSASGTRAPIEALGAGEVVLTFRNADGQLCRQFLIAGKAGTTDALSCRSAQGWTVEAIGQRPAPAGEIRTAAGDAAAPVLAAVDGMFAGEALIGADEKAALAGE
jgi:hypothetical protein